MAKNQTEAELLAHLRDQIGKADHGDIGALVTKTAELLGQSEGTVRRKLKDIAGFESGRKQRSDKGISVLSDAQLKLVAGVLLTSVNNRGQRMPVETALAMLRDSGALTVPVSVSTVGRQLRQRRLHPDQLTLPTPSQQMASRHPNHVWQVDSTTGAYYYLPNGRLRWMDETEFYKNKPDNLVKASSDLLTRYAATDHTSHAFKVRYYLGGETAENLLDFITWAMWKQDSSPMHGVPFMLIMDQGAANRGVLMRNFCKRTGVRLEHHAPGAARVTGSVEKAHDIVRMHFETRLRFVDPREVSLAWLNERITAWAASHCSRRKHTRHGLTRYGKWMQIKPDQLRVAASLEALREAAVREPETRRVANDRTVPFGGRTYDLTMVPGAVPGLRVTLAQNVFRAPAVDVLFTCPDTGAETWQVVQPVELDAHGFRVGSTVWGDEMRSAPYTDVDRARNDLTREAYKAGDGLPTLEDAAKARKAHAQAYAGVVDAMADVAATPVPTYLPRHTTPLPLPERRVEARRITVVEACIVVKGRIGAAYTPQTFADLSREFPEGVPEDQIDALCQRLAAPVDDAAEARTHGRAAGGL